jgi:hypothetical protein
MNNQLTIHAISIGRRIWNGAAYRLSAPSALNFTSLVVQQFPQAEINFIIKSTLEWHITKLDNSRKLAKFGFAAFCLNSCPCRAQFRPSQPGPKGRSR